MEFNLKKNNGFSRYQNIANIPLLVLSFIFVIIFVIGNFHLALAEDNLGLLNKLNWLIWAVFCIDYALMFILSENKSQFFRSHLVDLALVILPFLRVLRIIRVGMLFFRKIDAFKSKFIISIPLYTISSTILFSVLGASAVFDAEYQNDSANIKTPGDALWWAIVTVFTVGYGDKFPVTTEGRWYAVGLMACGIAVVGSVTATFASWLISQVREVESDQEKILQKIEEIQKKLDKS
jgi:voltage-gated potassium channel